MSPHREEPQRPTDHAHPDSRRTFIAKLAAAGLLTTALSETGCTAKSSSQLHLACQTNAWPSTAGLENLIPVLGTLKALDFEGYETSFRNVQEAYSNPEPARAQLEEIGLTCAGVHVAGPDLYLPETGIPSLDFLRAIATGSAALGAEYLILSGRGVSDPNGELNKEALSRKISALKDVAHVCNDSGIKLAYHNHADDFLNNGAEVDAILSASERDQISVWFCVHNAEKADVPIGEYFASHYDSISGVHLTNILMDSDDEHRFDGNALVCEMQKSDWKGWLIIEEERTRSRPDWPQTPAIEASREHVRSVFGV